MGNPITDFVKFIYKDLKSDAKFLYDLSQGKAKVRKLSEEDIAELKDWKGMLKANWLFFLIVIAAFCSGYFWGQVTLNNVCIEVVNDWVVANSDIFARPELQDSISNAFNYTFNFTK